MYDISRSCTDESEAEWAGIITYENIISITAFALQNIQLSNIPKFLLKMWLEIECVLQKNWQ